MAEQEKEDSTNCGLLAIIFLLILILGILSIGDPAILFLILWKPIVCIIVILTILFLIDKLRT